MANSDRTYLVARNTGVGPALIEEVVIRYHGSEIKQHPHVFFREARPEAVAGGFSVDRLMSGRLVSASQSRYDGFEAPKSGPDKAIIAL